MVCGESIRAKVLTGSVFLFRSAGETGWRPPEDVVSLKFTPTSGDTWRELNRWCALREGVRGTRARKHR